jgi:hypothetical protein
MPYPGADPSQNWGLAVPRHVYLAVVPRPPRPVAVQLAFVLSYAGVALAMVYLVANSFFLWSRRGDLAASLQRPGVDTTDAAGGFTTFVLVVTALYWLAVAAGVVVCTTLAQRGRNAPRIVLAVLAGVMAANHACGLGASAVGRLLVDQVPSGGSGTLGDTLDRTLAGIPWWAMVAQGLLGLLAGAIFVLLILPASNRYFSPGAGRRFAAGH